MNLRSTVFILAIVLLTTFSISASEPDYFYLAQEPLIRIGLSTNSSSVSITTGDSSLVAVSSDEPSKFLATTRITVSARAYHPPEIEKFCLAVQKLPSQNDANNLAKKIRDAT